MAKGRIKVAIEPGLFSTERSVSFKVNGAQYSLIVDASDVSEADSTLAVDVVAESSAEALIDLPRETFTSGNRIRVPKHFIIPTA